MHYHCLACRRLVERDDPTELPESDERCSHEWEPDDELNTVLDTIDRALRKPEQPNDSHLSDDCCKGCGTRIPWNSYTIAGVGDHCPTCGRWM